MTERRVRCACLIALSVLVVPSCTLQYDQEDHIETFSASIEVIVDDQIKTLSASETSNTTALAESFCRENTISYNRCTHFIQVDLDDQLWW